MAGLYACRLRLQILCVLRRKEKRQCDLPCGHLRLLWWNPSRKTSISQRKELLMEVKINREIRNYTESMFFGLSLRQFIFSVLACAVAVGLYFLLKPYLGTETVSWVCILGAAPFAALGFVKYNGMTAEKFIWAWIKSEFLMPKKLVFHSTNTYYELMKPVIEQKQKEAYKNND